jgi:uncharacterized protein (UPF0305 family)
MDKRKLLEERQRKWMSQRLSAEVLSETSAEDSKMSESKTYINSTSTISAARQRSESERSNKSNDEFLSKLTDKLSDRIREEIKKEIQQTNLLSTNENVARQAVGAKMESYLRAELSNYVCKICYEVMASPVHPPILLFPCGHTFW